MVLTKKYELEGARLHDSLKWVVRILLEVREKERENMNISWEGREDDSNKCLIDKWDFK